MKPNPHTPTLFPYTTLFRSKILLRARDGPAQQPPDPEDRNGGEDRHEPPGRPHEDPRREVRHRPEASDLRSEEHTSELQSQSNLVCRLLLEKKKIFQKNIHL